VNKKKYPTEKDKKDWADFTKNLDNIEDKDKNLSKFKIPVKEVRKLDLHGCSLDEANNKVRIFINKSYEENFRKLLVVTGKGSRSKAYEDPYRSDDMSILKNSVPNFIKSNEDLLNKIIKISKAEQQDGGDGAFYILLKNKL
jgi:DNA-nicking Smr family endonuclease